MSPLRAAALAAVLPILAGCVEKPAAPASVPEAAAHPCPSGWTTAERLAVWRAVPRVVLHVWDGERGASAVALFNDLTPPPDIAGDWLVVGLHADTGNALVLVGWHGCIVGEAFVRRALGEQIVNRIDGLKVNQ